MDQICEHAPMLSRVRQRDQVLAVLAVVGVVSGLALAILAKLHATGAVVVGLGMLAAVAIAAPKVVEPLAGLFKRQSRQEDHLHAVLVGGKPLAFADVDLFAIGVFRSEVAERTSRVTGAPEYVPREVDEALRDALEGTALDSSRRLVVLRGDPKAGKSRALWEAISQLQGRRLLALKAPDPGVRPPEPAAEPLATLLALERRLSTVKGRDLVIWIDDAQNHLGHGLTRDNLRRLTGDDQYPHAIIAATIHNHSLESIRDFDRELHALLREPFDDLLLEPRLSKNELASAQERYPSLANDPDLALLPEFFAAVPQLIDRYRQSRTNEPVGVAISAAAIAWQRAGMPPGSIDSQTLKALSKLTLREMAPARELTEEAFRSGLEWSVQPVATHASLVRRYEQDGSGTERYRAFDAVVSWVSVYEQPLPSSVWEFVLKAADVRSLSRVGIAAVYAQQPDVAERALIKARSVDDSQVSTAAAYNLGVFLHEQKRFGEAEEAYRAAVESGDSEYAPTANFNLGVLLNEQERFGEAEEAFRAAIESGHPEFAPQAKVNLGVLLNEQERLGEAEEAFRAVIESGHPDQAPKANFNLGLLFREQERLGEAEEAFRAAVESGHPDDSPMANFSLGVLFREQERLGEAEEAFRAAVESGHPEYAPQARVNLGVLLGEQERFGEAEEVYRAVIESGHPDQAPKANFNLGLLFSAQKRFGEAEEAYRAAIESGHPDQAPKARVNLGVLLREQERFGEAEEAYRAAIESGHPDQAPKANFNLGALFVRQERFGEAEEAFRAAVESSHPEYAPKANFSLGLLFVGQERFGEAEEAFRAAIGSGHPLLVRHAEEILSQLRR